MNTIRIPRIVLVAALASAFMLHSCAVSLRQALTMKNQGDVITYPLPYEQTYTAMRTALRWSSNGVLEDHKDQGYVLMNDTHSAGKYGSTWQDCTIVWLDSVSTSETKVTVLLNRFGIRDNIKIELYNNMNYAVELTKAGKPLPIMLSQEERGTFKGTYR
jgi:hypothetical protein